MQKQPRWMKSAIAAASETQVVLPWARGTRRRPAAVQPARSKSSAIAAR